MRAIIITNLLTINQTNFMKQKLHSLGSRMFKEKKRLVPWVLKKSTMLCVVLLNMSAFANTEELTANSLIEVDINKSFEKFDFQKNNITGKVTDSNGVPIPGANIVEKGKINGVQTDLEGKFSLAVEEKNAILVVSYIGFKTKEVSLEGQSSVSIQLEESSSTLNEVVVVAYGKQKRKV